MNYLKSALPIWVTFLLTTSLFAQSDDPSRWTPEDIINTEFLRNAQFSPNGNMLVWSKRKGVKKKDKFVSDLYLTRLDLQKDGEYRTFQLTNQKETDHSPLFSKDNETIYFLSSRDKGKKLWSLSIFGGEAKEVHEFKNGISNLQWVNDSLLAFVSNDGKTLYEQELEKSKDNVIVVEDSVHWKTNRIYTFDIKSKEIQRLTQNDYPVSGYKVSRNENWLVYWQTMSRHYASDANPDQQYFLKNLNTGETTRILKDLQTPYNFQFTADNEGFYFVAVLSSDPEWNGAGVSEVYHFDLKKKDYKKVNLDWDLGMEGGYWVVNNDILVALANKATQKIVFYEKKGKSWTKRLISLQEKEDHVVINAVSEDGNRVIFEHSTASQLPKYYSAYIFTTGLPQFSGQKELVKLNKKLQSKPIAKSEVFTWLGYNNEEVTGLLIYPENYQTGKDYPLILSIHGGPAGADLDLWRERWSTYPQLYSQRGAFVLKPNYHGSSNHGREFVESIKNGNYYDLELEDILEGIDALEKRGLIDKNRMGVMGWSNGAILATMLTVRYPDMFKVAAPGAGDVNWTSDFGTCRFGVSFDQSYFGGAPWDDVNGKTYNETYITKSPLFELEKVKTPTIIFHGSNDRAVPRDQGWEYYRALQQSGETAVRFLWFPGQPHGLQKITHQLRKMKEELKWIDKYLFQKETPENEAFKEDSPLAMLLQKDTIGRVGNNVGSLVNGFLVPEVVSVKKDSISIGRFEVTNAQYKMFQPNFRYTESQANYPALVSHKEAQNYIKWLNEQTSSNYRLPNAKEAKAWHKKAKKNAKNENTLNYWAGYDITPDEVSQLREKVSEAQLSLIKEVGSFKSMKVGNARVYDLGGNVAEYDSEGNVYGFGAYDFVDGMGESERVTEDNKGFRVVLKQ